MKKLLSGIFLLMALGLSFTACSDDDDENINHDATPEIATAGTYTGTWTRTNVSEGTATTATGTLTFESTGTPYVTKVSAKCEEFGIDKQCVANIAWVANDCLYNNMRATNDFGTTFSGKITAGSVANIAYRLTEREGRTTYIYDYTFEGAK